MSDTRVPEVRLAGYERDWAIQSLGDIVSFLRHNSLSRAELTKENTGIRNVHYGDVLVNYGEVLDLAVDEIPFVREATVKGLGDPLRDGDVVFADAAEDQTVGKCCEIRNVEGSVVVPGLHTVTVRPKQEFAPGYLGHALNSDSFHDQLIPLMQGSKVSSISPTALASCFVAYPPTAEQEAIGSLFTRFNSLLAHRQRRHAQLQQNKSSLMLKMFPRQGAAEPELRFDGFTGAWGERNLSSLCASITDGDWIESKDQSGSGIRLLQTGNVGVGVFAEKADRLKWVSQATFARLGCHEVMPGDILISRLPEPAGRACVVPNLPYRMITAVDCAIVRTSSDLANLFLVQHLSRDSYFRQIELLLAGGTRQRISTANLKATSIAVPPTITEQEAIGEFFAKLDSLIVAEKQYIGKLQQIKSALLQKMFVQGER